ncbi:hypothetical protein [Hyphobacterium sp.]|uniref:hypothetical protein n=1 Tax=Hyphobacterium sp. TaxID=2004662 RepID=UPI003749FC08
MTFTPEIIIHLGAGEGGDIERYKLMGARLVLIEARSEAISALSESVDGMDDAEVVEAVVTGGGGSRSFLRYNLPNASSLHLAKGMRSVYSGLEEVAREEVETISISSLLERYASAILGSVRLVLDVNGEEAALLDTLEADGSLASLAEVEVRCGVDALFDGGLTMAATRERLEQAGFNVEVAGAGMNRIVKARRAEGPFSMVEKLHPSAVEELQQLTARAELAERRAVEYESEVELLRENFNAVQEEALSFKTRCDAAERIAESATGKVAKLQEDFRALEEDALDLKSRSEIAERLAAGRANELKNLRKNAQDAEAEAAEQSSRLEEIGALRVDLEAALDGRAMAEAACVDLKKGLRSERGRTSAAKRKANNLASKLQKAVDALEIEQIELQQRDQQLEATRQEVVSLTAQIDTLQSALNDAQSKAEQAAEQKMRLDAMQASLQQRDQQLEAARQEAASLTAQIDTLQSALNDAQSRAEQAAEQKMRLEVVLEESAQQVAQLENEKHNLAQQLQAKNAEIDTLADGEHSSAEAQAEVIQKLEAERDEARNVIQGSKDDLSLSMRSQAMAQADLRSLQERYNELLQLKERQDEFLASLLDRIDGGPVNAAHHDMQPLYASYDEADESSDAQISSSLQRSPDSSEKSEPKKRSKTRRKDV